VSRAVSPQVGRLRIAKCHLVAARECVRDLLQHASKTMAAVDQSLAAVEQSLAADRTPDPAPPRRRGRAGRPAPREIP